MQNLLAFIAAIKDNSQFVAFTFVVCGLLGIMTITLSIQRTVRRKQSFDHRERLEQKRLDQARSIVPVRKMGDDVVS